MIEAGAEARGSRNGRRRDVTHCQRGKLGVKRRGRTICNILVVDGGSASNLPAEMIGRLTNSGILVLLSVIVLQSVWSSLAVEFTFELPDRDRECFYEEIKQGTRGTLEYQVGMKFARRSSTFRQTMLNSGVCSN